MIVTTKQERVFLIEARESEVRYLVKLLGDLTDVDDEERGRDAATGTAIFDTLSKAVRVEP